MQVRMFILIGILSSSLLLGHNLWQNGEQISQVALKMVSLPQAMAAEK